METGETTLITYIVASVRDCNIQNYYKITRNISADWHLFTTEEELTFEKVEQLKPRYIFFPHWSWSIPEDIFKDFECVAFHMTDLPFGRGGSPLQNLISRGIYETIISAFRVTDLLDAGPIYLKRKLCLHGSADEMFARASYIIFDMIGFIIANQPTPVEQEGNPLVFKRRTPKESLIPDVPDLNKVFDWIRMLDAEEYPKAFIETKNLRLEFTRANLKNGYILADVRIIPKEQTE